MNSSCGEVWDTFLFTPFFTTVLPLLIHQYGIRLMVNQIFGSGNFNCINLSRNCHCCFICTYPPPLLYRYIHMNDRLPTLMLIVSNCPSIITLRAGPPSIHMLWLRQMSLHIMTIILIYKHTLWPSPNNTQGGNLILDYVCVISGGSEFVHRQGESNSRLLQHQPCQSIKRQQMEQNLLDIILCQWISDW